MLWLLERAIAIPLLLALFLTAGSIANRWIAGPRLRSLRDLVERCVVGLAAWVAVLFVCATVGLYRPLALVLVAVVCLGLGANILLRERQLGPGPLVEGSQAADGQATFRPLVLVNLTGLVGLLMVLWVHSARPDVFGDASVYHLTVPKLWLEHGGFAAIPFNVYSHWPMALDLVFGLAMALRDFVLAKQVHFATGLLVVLAFFAYARYRSCSWRGAGVCTGIMASAIFLANPVVLFEIRVAYIDVGMALVMLVGVHASHACLQAESTEAGRYQSWLLGLCCGLLCAMKLSGFLYAGSILLVHLLVSLSRRGGRSTLKGSLPIVLPTVLLGVVWPIKSWLLTGNPTYPLMYSVFGGPDWSLALANQHSAWQQSIGMGRGLTDYLLLPWRVVMEGGQGYARFDGALHRAWLVLVPLVLLQAIKRPRAPHRWFLATAATFFCAWALTSQQIRFLIPLLGPASSFAAAAVMQTLEGVGRAWKASHRAVLASLIATGLLVYAWSGAVRLASQVPTIVNALVALNYQAVEAATPQIYRAANQLPADSRLLLINHNLGFHLEHPYLADSFFEASQVRHLFASTKQADEAHAIARQRGVTHLLIEHRNLGIPYSSGLRALLQDRRYARPIYATPDQRFSILELSR